ARRHHRPGRHLRPGPGQAGPAGPAGGVRPGRQDRDGAVVPDPAHGRAGLPGQDERPAGRQPRPMTAAGPGDPGWGKGQDIHAERTAVMATVTAICARPPLPYRAALRGLTRCTASTARLLWQHRLRLPARWVGTRLRFADGTSARVYRETVADRGATLDPCVLVVEF